MNLVTGKVLLKETNAPIPDLLVEIYDVDPGAYPKNGVNEQVSTRLSEPLNPTPLGDRLGSGLTDAAGLFRLEYADEDFRRCHPEEQRPDLLLLVRAPEDMDSQETPNVLHISPDIRQGAGPNEVYVIRIPSHRLASADILSPTGQEIKEEAPEAIIAKASQSVSRQTEIRQAVQQIATDQVAAHRERTQQVEQQVETRLFEKLSGVPTQLAERLNYVQPGGDVEQAMFLAINKSIETTINPAPPTKGFLVLTPEQAQPFQKEDGSFRDDIRPEEIHPLLFGGAAGEQRPTFFYRKDPNAPQPDLPPIDEQPGGEGTRGKPSDTGANPDANPPPGTRPLVAASASEDRQINALPLAGEAPPATIPEFVNHLIATMTSPEEEVVFGVEPRATQDEVDGTIGNFQLHTGPADVPAFYDFHSLQIAYDYVWQKAIDDGVIESAKTLSRQIQEMGGNPAAALESSSDPVKALRTELRLVQAAHAESNLTQLMSTPNRVSLRIRPGDIEGGPGGGVFDGGGGGGGGGGPIFPGGDVITFPPGPVFDPGNSSGTFPHELLNQIESLLNERFAFEAFAPGSVNFGVLVTYRQRWAPISYQVGDLIKTITLTPKETRKVTTRQVIKKERSIKEMENSLRIRKEDSSATSRDEAEIIAKAEAKTNFNLTAKGAFNIGIAKGDSTTVFGKDAATTSSDTKKAFREAVIKAAQEFKDERKLEVETKESSEEETTVSTEITNPNEEIPVTFLFYELQRRFQISEHIYRLVPVVLVAMDVPNPSRQAIDKLLLTYGWIIDRVLLDDQFRKPLEYFRTRLAGEEFALHEMEKNLNTMRAVVDELKKSYIQARVISNQSADLLTAETVRRAQAIAEGDSEGFFEKASESLFGDGGDESIEAYRTFEEVARERYERAVNKEKEIRAQLDSESAALKTATDEFARALAENLNCQMDVGTLRLHIKENILYYMQAIWSHTFNDQLFLQLHKKKAPRLAPKEHSYKMSQPDEPPSSAPASAGQLVVQVEPNLELEGDLNPEEDFVTLAEIADLDTLLGFKGNYLIFPMRQSNALTDFMMTPFVDAELGLRDPDEFGNFTPEEFVEYAHGLVEQMRQQLENGEITEEQLQEAIDQLSEQLRRLLSAPNRPDDEITVPTGSLFVEALPGAHPILEDFKLKHRAMDVKKVQAEVRRLELENVRYAARILVGEREDPDIERKVVISANGQTVVVPPIDN